MVTERTPGNAHETAEYGLVRTKLPGLQRHRFSSGHAARIARPQNLPAALRDLQRHGTNQGGQKLIPNYEVTALYLIPWAAR
jgi:hypothetical protein